VEKAKVLAPSTVLMVDAQKRFSDETFLKKYFPRKPDAVAN
jgi:hypothetical protein